MGEAKRRRENQAAAARMVDADRARFMRGVADAFTAKDQTVTDEAKRRAPEICAAYGAAIENAMNGGSGMMIAFEMGRRDNLTEAGAADAARIWRQTVRKYPGAAITIHIAGYDEDPRELWDLPDVCAYVRRWATLTGIFSPNDLPATSATREFAAINAGFLAACGVFGESLKRQALRGKVPAKAN